MPEKHLDARDRALEKRQTRARAILRLKSTPLSPGAGERLLAHLLPNLEVATGDDTWALFASLPWEIDLEPIDNALIEKGIGRVFPTIVGDTLEFRKLGPREPYRSLAEGAFKVRTPTKAHPIVPLSSCSVVITPGVLFGRDGTRLGYGRGFYDRALGTARAANPNLRSVGVAFGHQVEDTVISFGHDLDVDAVVTDGGVVFRSSARAWPSSA